MPFVSDQFVEHAKALAAGTSQLLAEKAENEKLASDIRGAAELTTETLAAQGLIPQNEKKSAVSQLMDHRTALAALNKTAQVKSAMSMGSQQAPQVMGKAAGDTTSTEPEVDYRGEPIRESDRTLFRALGLG